MGPQVVCSIHITKEKKMILHSFSFLFFHHIPPNQQICHYVFSPSKEEPFILGMLFCKHEILANNTIEFSFLAFPPPNMLLEAIELGNHELFLPFNLWAHSTPNHIHIPLRTNNGFQPWKLWCPISWNIQLISYSRTFFFSSTFQLS